MNRKLEINHGIIYGENDLLHRKSCIIFKRRFCLAPASVILQWFDHIENGSIADNIKRDLKINRIIDSNADQRYKILTKYNFKIVHECNDILYKSNATIIKIFKCRNIWNSFNDILRSFVVRSVKNENNDLHKLLLSSFIFLRIKIEKETIFQKNSSLAIFKDISESIFKTEQRHNDVLRMNIIRKLENIESVSSPFGNECFLNTINVGRIANIFGDNKCLMIASMPLVPGCEGGAVYNKENNDLIGIVISTTFDWNRENATLTLVAKFDEIMAEFIEQSQLTSINIENEFNISCSSSCLKSTKLNCKSLSKDSLKLENFIVLIQSAGLFT